MDSPVGIKYTFSTESQCKSIRIKEKTDDFVVQEVVDGVVCTIGPVVDVERFLEADQLLSGELASELSKEERKQIYAVANYHPFKRTFTKDGKLCVELNSSDVFVFTVLKREYSDLSLQKHLARKLGVPLEQIQTGGTKDKHGITLQEVSAKCTFERLFNYALSISRAPGLEYEALGYTKEISDMNSRAADLFSGYMRVDGVDDDAKVVDDVSEVVEAVEAVEDAKMIEDVRIYNIRRGRAKKLGDLTGNYFTIRVRGYFDGTQAITKFYNYFGPQRFGNNMNNHVVGEMILNGDHQGALDLILADGEATRSITQKQIQRMAAEGATPQRIIERLPRKTQMIYMHAYQSYIFNKDVNRRVESGRCDVEDDRVLVGEDFVQPSGNEDLSEIYVPLKKMKHKLLKGGMRKMIEEVKDFQTTVDEEGTVFKFFLPKSSYATVALRELAGEVSE